MKRCEQSLNRRLTSFFRLARREVLVSLINIDDRGSKLFGHCECHVHNLVCILARRYLALHIARGQVEPTRVLQGVESEEERGSGHEWFLTKESRTLIFAVCGAMPGQKNVLTRDYAGSSVFLSASLFWLNKDVQHVQKWIG